MRDETKQKLLFLAENRKELGEILAPDHEGMCAAGSLLLTMHDQRVETEKIQRAAKLFRKHTSILSPFRGYLSAPVTVKMSQQAEAEDYYLDIQNLYKRFNSGHLMGAEYHILSSILLYDQMGSGSNWTHIYKANELLERMSGEYRFLPDQADLPMALVWNMTGREQDEMMENMNENYRILREYFKDANIVQMPAQFLVLSEERPQEKCARLMETAGILKERQQAPESKRELAALALLTMTDRTAEEIAEELMEMDALLASREEKEAVFTERPVRRLYEAVLAMETAGTGIKKQAAELCAMIAIAETAAVCKTRR